MPGYLVAVSWPRGSTALLLLCLALQAPAQAPGAPIDPGSRVRQLAEQQGAQTELPSNPGQGGRPGRAPDPNQRRGWNLGRDRSGSLRWNLSGFSGLAAVLGYGALALVVVLVIVALVRAIGERRREPRLPRQAPAPVTPAAALAPPPSDLPDHERLAAAGRYGEAVHALLLQAFVQLATRRGTGWPLARTGREILAAVGGFQSGDAPLQLVFRTAESAWFGGVRVDQQAYAACLANYRTWSSA